MNECLCSQCQAHDYAHFHTPFPQYFAALAALN